MSYIPQFVLNLRYNDAIDETDETKLTAMKPILTYISIFNPDLVDKSKELNEELSKQILMFIPADDSFAMSEKLNVIGLCMGIDLFAREFGSSDNNKMNNNVVMTNKSAMILEEIEPSFFLTCKVEIPYERDADTITRQLSSTIEQASHYFKMLNKPINDILLNQGRERLEEVLTEFWSGFMDSFNESNGCSLPFKWPNPSIGYKGFLGLLPTNHKKSSINLNSNCINEIHLMTSNAAGVMVSNFDKTVPKNYGLVFSQSSIIKDDSLHCLYNWLELHDQQNKLDTTHLTSRESRGLYELPIVHHELLNQELLSSLQLLLQMLLRQNLLDSSSVRSSSLQSTFDIFNPMKITNNLVILPLNATVNGVRNLGTSTNRWLAAPSLSVPSISVPSLKVPLYLNPFGETESRATAPVTSPRANAVESSADVDSGHTDNDTEEQPIGTFLVGLVANIHDPSTIHNKLVYLQNKDDNTYAEYLLVIYERDNVVVTLIYESSYGLLKVASFYEELTSSSLEPLIEEIFSSTGGGGGSHLGTTAGSLSSLPRSLNGYPGSDDVQEFFFIIFDPKEKSVQSSFPYLQKHEFTLVISVDHTTRLQNRLNNTVYFLHDILIDVFLVQGGDEFLNSENSTMREYFHKFNGGKATDWMFYYIQYHGKFIIIIKNHNPKVRKPSSAVPRRESVVPATDLSSTTSPPVSNGILSNITDGIYDYANLGFLDNLGEDVKQWLEGFSTSGET